MSTEKEAPLISDHLLKDRVRSTFSMFGPLVRKTRAMTAHEVRDFYEAERVKSEADRRLTAIKQLIEP